MRVADPGALGRCSCAPMASVRSSAARAPSVRRCPNQPRNDEADFNGSSGRCTSRRGKHLLLARILRFLKPPAESGAQHVEVVSEVDVHDDLSIPRAVPPIRSCVRYSCEESRVTGESRVVEAEVNAATNIVGFRRRSPALRDGIWRRLAYRDGAIWCEGGEVPNAVCAGPRVEVKTEHETDNCDAHSQQGDADRGASHAWSLLDVRCCMTWSDELIRPVGTKLPVFLAQVGD